MKKQKTVPILAKLQETTARHDDISMTVAAASQAV
jgi:hypothetical protein